MEVGKQQVDVGKGKARCDENLRVAPRLPGLCPRFQCAHRGGPDCQHAPAARAAVGNGLLRGRRHVVPLAVHAVLAQILGFDGLERAGADVQRDECPAYAERVDCVEQRLVEVQRRRRGRDGARMARKHGLVTLGILGGVGVRDVRGQRHVAVALHQGVGVVPVVVGQHQPVQRAVGVRPAPEQRGTEAVAAASAVHADRAADFGFFADTHVGSDLVAAEHPLDQQFHFSTGGLFAKQACLQHFGVVKNQQVFGLQEARQRLHHAVLRRAAGGVEQPGGTAHGRRVLRNQLGREFKIKVAQTVRIWRDHRGGNGGHGGSGPDKPAAGVKKGQNCPMSDSPDRSRPSRPARAATARTADAKSGAAKVAKSPQLLALEKLGLRRDIDLALHLPLRYEDETRITRLRDARDGDVLQIEGHVVDCEVTYRPRRQLVVRVDDGGDVCTLRFFNFYPSQQKAMAVGAHIRARGEIRGGFAGWTMLHPACKRAGGVLPMALTPVYPSVAGLTQTYLRQAVLDGLARAELSDTFAPGDLGELNPHALWTLREALQFLHHPTPDVSLETLQDNTHPAWQRLKAEELLAQQLSQLQSRRERAALRAPALVAPGPAPAQSTLQTRLLAVLPFALTAAQQRVGREIAADMARPVPMHRLLQGDVGAGKTVVAALAAAICIDAGWQCALMAPTEILAEQHFRKLIGWLEPLGITTAWLTGTQKTAQRRAMLALVESGEARLVVGTHAVIQEKVRFHNLALAIIDEQHRFGVAQRLALRSKLQHDAMEPHLLMMTATPIPRTLAMSYYADLDVSTLDELPPGRTPVITRVVSAQRRDEVVQRIRAQIAQGRQIYWVCPLIEESEALDLRNATETHADLAAALADVHTPQGHAVQVGLIHSRLPTPEKKAVMAAFVQGTLSVLVSTTVIEVGVDVPNASLMVIEHAERFGLSQLHQLRGRVGRGAAASACVLLYSAGEDGRLGESARERLRAMAATSDGFEIARRDLEIRGPGEFLGARQSGDAMLRFADLATDTALLEWARAEAVRMWDQHPQLAQRHVQRWLGSRAHYLKA